MCKKGDQKHDAKYMWLPSTIAMHLLQLIKNTINIQSTITIENQ